MFIEIYFTNSARARYSRAFGRKEGKVFKKLFSNRLVPLGGIIGGSIAAYVAKKKGKDPVKWGSFIALLSMFLVWLGIEVKKEIDANKKENPDEPGNS